MFNKLVALTAAVNLKLAEAYIAQEKDPDYYPFLEFVSVGSGYSFSFAGIPMHSEESDPDLDVHALERRLKQNIQDLLDTLSLVHLSSAEDTGSVDVDFSKS